MIDSIKDIIEKYPELEKTYKKISTIVITKQKYRYNFNPTLRLAFLDVEKGDDDFIRKIHADKLSSIMPELQKSDLIIVACDAGLSRSPAVAYAIAWQLNDEMDAIDISNNYRFLNKDVFRFLRKEMRR